MKIKKLKVNEISVENRKNCASSLIMIQIT